MVRSRRVLLLGVLCGALLGCAATGERDRDEAVPVERGALPITVDVEGTIRAVESSVVTPPGVPGVWDYKIAMMVPEGTAVPEGQPILGFDPSELQRRMEAKASERDSAAKQLELQQAASRMARQDEKLGIADAQGELRKAKQKADAPEGITASVDMKKAKLDLELAREKLRYLERKRKAASQGDAAQVRRWESKHARAQARVEEIGKAIEHMVVEAPRAGTVIYETNWRGEKKKVGDSAWRAETIMQVASLEQMEARGEVDEVDANKVAVEQPVTLRLDAQPDVELTGHVREISQSVRRTSPDNPLKTLRIDIFLDATDAVALRPGMRFRGRVEIERAQDVLMIPLELVQATADGPVVWGEDGTRVSVSLGRRNATHVEVLEGVAEGTRLRRPRRDEAEEAAP